MSASHHADWIARLESIAAPHAPQVPDLAAFRDELAHRRDADRPFLAFALNRDPGDSPRDAPSPQATLWWSLHNPSINITPLLSPPGPAPVLRNLEASSVEFAGEADLCALHALWAIARVRTRPDLRARALEAARWHVEHTAPDNSAAHPWAIHVFILLADEPSVRNKPRARPQGPAEAGLYAQTLLHNAITMLGKPDARSALIMLDAARELTYATAPPSA